MATPTSRMSVSNPAATGSGGPAFETKVSAACLALLLTRGAPPFLGTGTLRSVHLQAGHLGLGWSTDDLLLEATDAGGQPMKAALQVKRSFSLSARDPECTKTVRGAFADFRRSAQFDQQRDVVAIITSSLSTQLARGLRTLLDCARASLNAEDMARRLAIPNYLGQPAKGYYQTIVEILEGAEGGSPSDEETWRFLRRFGIIDLDLNVTHGIIETLLRTLLAATLPDDTPEAVDATWNELLAMALNDAGSAMSYTRETLPRVLLERHSRATKYSQGVSRVLEDSEVVLTGIPMTIAQKAALPRRELTGKLSHLIETSPLVFVTGAAGSGKSALVKSVFTIATQCSIGFAFRADSLAGSHINDVLSHRQLTLSSLQAQTAMHGKKLLWVESLERLMERPPEQRTAFLDLLRKLTADPTWRLVVTCRDYSAETVRTAFFSEVGVTPANIEVGTLSDDELNEVVVSFPALQRPLRNPSLRSLLRNPFYLDKAAKMNWPVTEPLPTTERGFREKVWNEVARRVDEDMASGLPTLRGQTMVEIALRRAKALTPFVSADNLDPRALGRLVRDSLLHTPDGSDHYAPLHDVFEDWALMRWLDEKFAQQGGRLDSLLCELGTYPALRRAYRRWLTEFLSIDPLTTDSMVVALIQNSTVPAHWREDTLVGVLQSTDARGFIDRNAAMLLADGAKLLRQVLHILRVACRAAIPKRMFGVDSAGDFLLPQGNGWIGAGLLLEAAIPLFTDEDFMLILRFLEEWVLLRKSGLGYPIGASSIAKAAWRLCSQIPSQAALLDAEDRLMRVILTIPRAEEQTLTAAVETALENMEQGLSNRDLLNLIFNHFACDSIVKDLPDLAFRVAEHMLGLDQSLESVITVDWNSRWSGDVEHAFGFGKRLYLDDFPSSALHGPYLRMLLHHPSRGVDFILRMVNRAGDAYAHPENRCEHIEPPTTIKIHLPDGPRIQHANWRLFSAYRGMHVSPKCFESALMALEHWLLERARREDEGLEAILLDLLGRTNNVTVTAIVASVAAAKPLLAGEAAFALLTCRELLKADFQRSVNESFLSVRVRGFRFPRISNEKGSYDNERLESAQLEHRSRNLEYVAVALQTTVKFRDRVWALIDHYKSVLPPEGEQDEETKIWRIQLHRLDTRNLIETGRTEEGRIILGSVEPEPDLQVLVERQRPRTVAFDCTISLLNWGQSVFEGKTTGEDWREQISLARAQFATDCVSDGERDLAAGGLAYVAAVCIRDHWPEMTAESQEWCAKTVCDAIDADADTEDHFLVVAHNPIKGSRPAAFALSALFGKTLVKEMQARLLPTLAKAVMHAVEETVVFAMRGVARFLWASDRALALTCVQALIKDASERHSFSEKRKTPPFTEREPENQFYSDLRLKLREFISHRGAANEEQIGTLDIARSPGRSIARHLFTIATENPNDPLLQQLMQRSTALLPMYWQANARGHRARQAAQEMEGRYDSLLEHDVIDAVCQFALKLKPAQGLAFLEPVFTAALRFPEKASKVVSWLILHQGNRAPAPTLWALWQRFADDFAAELKAHQLEAEHSGETQMIRELFLGTNWGDQRDWHPLHGETQRLRAFFLRLPPKEQTLECYAYYLAKAGTTTLPGALIDVASKLSESSKAVLNETAIFYLEEILTRLIYGGNSQIRAQTELRQATLTVLDALVASGSSPAFKLREDFLTPVAS